MMAQIDFKLTNDGVDIPTRPIMAVREVSITYSISMPLGGDAARLPPELRENAPLSEAINQWYKENYGDRLKEDPCPGRMAILLDGDLYVLRVPRIFGSVNFVLTRQWLPNPGIGPGACPMLRSTRLAPRSRSPYLPRSRSRAPIII
jgi:hypothetical protein